MYVIWGLYIDSALLFLNTLAYASVPPRNDSHLSADMNRRQPMLSQHTASQGSHTSIRVSSKPADVILKRVDDQVDDLWVRSINILTSSIPSSAAAAQLEEFYYSILCNTLAAWAQQPAQQMLFLNMGRLQLSMSVVMNSGAPQGIPWAFVRNFARNMLMMTRLGFVGTYNMYYMRHSNPSLPNLGVEVRLRILWHI